MGIVYIAFILATGYIFSILYLPASHRISKSDGWVTYFQVAKYGFCFFLFTLPFLIYIDLKDYARPLSNIIGFKYYHFKELGITPTDAKVMVWAVFSILLALLTGCISWFIYKLPILRNRVIKKSVRGDVLESVIYDHTQSNLNKYEGSSLSYISVTLKSRKVYVGLCNETTLGSGSITAIKLTPVLSGYRDKDTLQVNYKTNYFDHYSAHYLKDAEVNYEQVFNKFKVTLTIAEVESIGLFDIDEYIRFQNLNKPKFDWYNLQWSTNLLVFPKTFSLLTNIGWSTGETISTETLAIEAYVKGKIKSHELDVWLKNFDMLQYIKLKYKSQFI